MSALLDANAHTLAFISASVLLVDQMKSQGFNFVHLNIRHMILSCYRYEKHIPSYERCLFPGFHLWELQHDIFVSEMRRRGFAVTKNEGEFATPTAAGKMEVCVPYSLSW